MQRILSSSSLSEKPEEYGGKAAGLFVLRGHGFLVPPFYLLSYQVISGIVAAKVDTSLLVAKWIKENGIAAASRWAVRSSAHVEDGKEQSFAGLFTSRLNVLPSGLAGAIGEVVERYREVRQLEYNRFGDFEFAIIVQQMLQPDYAGVAFSHNPLNTEEEVSHINIVPGQGEALVSGKAEAFMVTHDGRRFSFLNETDNFVGEQFDGSHIIAVRRPGSEIKKAVGPFLPMLVKGLRSLSQLKGHPVDVEFAIVAGRLYWLQVRPITSGRKEQVLAIWDNSNITENYPGLTLPLSISYTRRTYCKGYTGMIRFLGMSDPQVERNRPLLENMVGGVNGSMYYNITAWQQLLYQLPFGKKTSRWITRIWGMEDAPFVPPAAKSSVLGLFRLLGHLLHSFVFFKKHKRRFEGILEETIASFDPGQLKNKSHEELIGQYFILEKKLGDNWIAPLLNGFYALLLFTSLKKILRRSRLSRPHPNFINDILYSQGDVVSVQIVKDFQRLISSVQGDEALWRLFRKTPANALPLILQKKYPAFWKDVSRYIERFGERAQEGELKMETCNYKDDPALFVAFLQQNAVAAFDRKKKDVLAFDYRQVIGETYAFNPLKKAILLQLIKVTIPRIKDRENYRFARTKSFHVVRHLFRAMGRAVHQKGFTDEEADFLFLEFDELTDPSLAQGYKKRIAARKEEYKKYKNLTHAPRYIQTLSGWKPVEKRATANAKSTLSGTGCSSGIVTAEVVEVTGASMDSGGLSDKILIANHFEPGWIHLFAQAAGVISERGNLLSHTAILCREMGIPSIVGAKGLMVAVKDGDLVQMDGAAGQVHLLKKRDARPTTTATKQ
ncbi:MAG TPA: hypothetical protein ENJ95_24495 [Bacteroidetes bacterium]|nr:hypothetical protein [Bacteroidota bacterium]